MSTNPDGQAKSETSTDGDKDRTNDASVTPASPVEHADESRAYPTSDRHAAETLAARLEHKGPAESGVPPSDLDDTDG